MILNIYSRNFTNSCPSSSIFLANLYPGLFCGAPGSFLRRHVTFFFLPPSLMSVVAFEEGLPVLDHEANNNNAVAAAATATYIDKKKRVMEEEKNDDDDNDDGSASKRRRLGNYMVDLYCYEKLSHEPTLSGESLSSTHRVLLTEADNEALKSLLVKSRSENAELSMVLIELNQKVQKLSNENNYYRTKILEGERQYNDLKVSYDGVRDENRNITDSNLAKSTEISGLLVEKQNLESTIEDLKVLIENLKIDMKNRDEVIAILREDIDMKIQSIEDFKKRVRDFELNVESLTSTITDMIADGKEKEMVWNSLSDEYKGTICTLEETLRECRNTLDLKSEECDGKDLRNAETKAAYEERIVTLTSEFEEQRRIDNVTIQEYKDKWFVCCEELDNKEKIIEKLNKELTMEKKTWMLYIQRKNGGGGGGGMNGVNNGDTGGGGDNCVEGCGGCEEESDLNLLATVTSSEHSNNNILTGVDIHHPTAAVVEEVEACEDHQTSQITVTEVNAVVPNFYGHEDKEEGEVDENVDVNL